MEGAGRGHLGPAFSMVEILNVLFEKVLRLDPKNPKWPDRDRFILSKGHGCLSYYAILARKGFFPMDELKRFCRPEGILGGHPDHRKIPGVETSTGSLGHGLSVGVGLALAARIDKRPYRTYVVTGDGECNEGSVWEAALSAAKHKLGTLTVLVDYNKMQSYAAVRDVLELEPFADKWRSFGFETHEVDGHDPTALERILLTNPDPVSKPRALVCHTIKGKGAPFAENNVNWHHKNKLTAEEIRALYDALKD